MNNVPGFSFTETALIELAHKLAKRIAVFHGDRDVISEKMLPLNETNGRKEDRLCVCLVHRAKNEPVLTVILIRIKQHCSWPLFTSHQHHLPHPFSYYLAPNVRKTFMGTGSVYLHRKLASHQIRCKIKRNNVSTPQSYLWSSWLRL